MKGSISEFELGVLRARMLDAARSKASRGELRLSVPFGYIWHRQAGLGLDPDLRLQEVIRLIFTRFRELGSARQVLLSMKADQIHFPRPSDEGRMTSFDWVPIRYRNAFTQEFTCTGKARNAPPSSKGGHGGATGMASRSGHGR
jgi:DNA invertase Pin-like site-specific DNA recombinase